MIRYFKKCEEFALCAELGEGGIVETELASERYTLYQVMVKGSGRLGKIFKEEHIVGDANNGIYLADLREYIGHHTVYESFEPFHIYGFNTLDLRQSWDGKLISGSFDGDDKSWLVVFRGNPIINGKNLREMDYAKLENKHYDVQLNDGIVGVFTKL